MKGLSGQTVWRNGCWLWDRLPTKPLCSCDGRLRHFYAALRLLPGWLPPHTIQVRSTEILMATECDKCCLVSGFSEDLDTWSLLIEIPNWIFMQIKIWTVCKVEVVHNEYFKVSGLSVNPVAHSRVFSERSLVCRSGYCLRKLTDLYFRIRASLHLHTQAVKLGERYRQNSNYINVSTCQS